jgi:hypothetical protein
MTASSEPDESKEAQSWGCASFLLAVDDEERGKASHKNKEGLTF